MIVIFVLCGFVNLLLIVILLGGLGGMVFGWWKDIVCLGFRVVLVGFMVNFMSVVIVGFFFLLV